MSVQCHHVIKSVLTMRAALSVLVIMDMCSMMIKGLVLVRKCMTK